MCNKFVLFDSPKPLSFFQSKILSLELTESLLEKMKNRTNVSKLGNNP